MMTLMVSRGYALSRLVIRTRLVFLKTWGGVNVLDSSCLETRCSERCDSAHAKLESAAMQLAKKEVDLMLGSSQAIRALTRSVWEGEAGGGGVGRACNCCVRGLMRRVPSEFLRHLRVRARQLKLHPSKWSLAYIHQCPL